MFLLYLTSPKTPAGVSCLLGYRIVEEQERNDRLGKKKQSKKAKQLVYRHRE